MVQEEYRPLVLQDTVTIARQDIVHLWRDADHMKTMLEWLEGVLELHQRRDDTRLCSTAHAALEAALHQLGVAADHINRL